MDGLNDRCSPPVLARRAVPVLLDHVEGHLSVFGVIHLVQDNKEHVETREKRVGEIHVLGYAVVLERERSDKVGEMMNKEGNHKGGNVRSCRLPEGLVIGAIERVGCRQHAAPRVE